MNKIIVIGNLVRDPENTTTSGGTQKTTFTIAVQRKFNNANGEKETDFLSVVTWRALAENCGKYLRKGSKAAVIGSVQTRSYEVDGQKRYITEIVAEEVEFLSRSNTDDGQAKNQGDALSHKTKSEQEDDDGLPF